MTATIDLLTVTHSIASLSISGVTVKDTHEIADAINLGTAILAPNPAGFMTDVQTEYDESSQQLIRLSYTLHYRYYHCAISGGLGGIFGVYASLLTNAMAILLALNNDATLAGALNNTAPTMDYIGGVQDLSGNNFHGADFSIRITQFLEV